MVTWRSALPSNDAARVLLDQYFQARAQGFPDGPEAYRRTEPVDAEYRLPVGVFLIAEGENLSGEPADVGCGGIRRVADGPLGARFELKHLWVLRWCGRVVRMRSPRWRRPPVFRRARSCSPRRGSPR